MVLFSNTDLETIKDNGIPRGKERHFKCRTATFFPFFPGVTLLTPFFDTSWHLLGRIMIREYERDFEIRRLIFQTIQL
jgi:hypothetical protein